MGYKALYREWRPQDFRSLVGQDHISQTLQNAVLKGRIAHAYLFAGPRGTGKTSLAKIMAKVVNCLAPAEGQPCNSCLNCLSINEGRSLDVIEIDAASNRGIDEIRDLRERVNFVPSQGKYKVYIIDEVHMLTTEAFNALLKTLEEPPAHVIFILATTEPQKIPPTILSRCQRFDFKKILPREMEGRLRKILEASGMTAEDGVLDLVIKKAEGGLRDAISILDQCMSFSQEHISLDTAHEVMGIVRSEALLAVSQAMLEKDAPGLLAQINDMLHAGIEPGQVIRDLLEHFRNMMLLLVCGSESRLVLTGSEEKERMLSQGNRLGLNWLSQAVAALSKIEGESRWRQNLRIALETTLLNLVFQEETQVNPKPAINPEPAKRGAFSATARTQQGTSPGKKESVPPAGDVTPEIAALSLDAVKEKWPVVMEMIKKEKRTLHAFLTECDPQDVQGDKLVLAFKSGYSFHQEKVEEPDNKKTVETVLAKVLGRKIGLSCVLKDEGQGAAGDSAQKALNLFGPGVVVFKD